MKKKDRAVISPAAVRAFKARKATTRRIIDRANELEKSSNVSDRQVARELYRELVKRSTEALRELEFVKAGTP